MRRKRAKLSCLLTEVRSPGVLGCTKVIRAGLKHPALRRCGPGYSPDLYTGFHITTEPASRSSQIPPDTVDGRFERGGDLLIREAAKEAHFNQESAKRIYQGEEGESVVQVDQKPAPLRRGG